MENKCNAYLDQEQQVNILGLGCQTPALPVVPVSDINTLEGQEADGLVNIQTGQDNEIVRLCCTARTDDILTAGPKGSRHKHLLH